MAEISETNIEEVVDKTIRKTYVALDATLLTAIMSCPRYTDLRFNNNLVQIGGKSNSLEVGSIVHIFLEHYYKSRINGLDVNKSHGQATASAELYIRGCKFCSGFIPYVNDETGIEITKPTCGHKPNEYPGVVNTPQVVDKDNKNEKFKIGWQWALDTCDQYLKYYSSDFWIPLFAEEVKGKVLYEDEDIRILWKAKLDLGVDTNQGIFPVDHKTMKQNRSGLSLNNQFIGQCHVMGTRSMIINKIGFQTTLEPKERFIREMVSYSVPRLLEWQREILPYYAKLLVMYSENGYFPPQFDHCEGKYGKCNFHKVCEADPLMREELLKQNFVVSEAWNPKNDNDED
jgi:hypothetical protein